jgi:hypothetical protein
MPGSFEVYAVQPLGPVWLGDAKTLSDAIELMQLTGSGDYCVFSHVTMHGRSYHVSENGAVSLLESPMRSQDLYRS